MDEVLFRKAVLSSVISARAVTVSFSDTTPAYGSVVSNHDETLSA